MEVTPKAKQKTVEGPAEWFTGKVTISAQFLGATPTTAMTHCNSGIAERVARDLDGTCDGHARPLKPSPESGARTRANVCNGWKGDVAGKRF